MPHEVVFLVFDGAKLLDVSGPAEVLAEANRAGADYSLRFVSPSGQPVLTSAGITIGTDGRADRVRAAQTVIVAGGDRVPHEPMAPELVDAVRHLLDVSARVCSICTGAFILAATGELRGRAVATHWAHTTRLARAYPDVRVDDERLYVRDGRFHSSAGVSAGIDLALSLVEADHDAEIARRVARQLVVHLHRQGGQSQFSALVEIPHPQSSPVQRVIEAVTANPARRAALADLARIGRVSERHLSRLFSTEIGLTPSGFVETVRIDAAKNALLTGATVDATARIAGFPNPEAMRRTFVARLGLTPSAYRARFSSSGGPQQSDHQPTEA